MDCSCGIDCLLLEIVDCELSTLWLVAVLIFLFVVDDMTMDKQQIFYLKIVKCGTKYSACLRLKTMFLTILKNPILCTVGESH